MGATDEACGAVDQGLNHRLYAPPLLGAFRLGLAHQADLAHSPENVIAQGRTTHDQGIGGELA